ncbi:hypothetical protein [Acinetobacter sp. ANC 4173]|jgi:hypothetical protein|uniref:hypothetical protein n=1 Tax=Acinetobacter sp. ANC 4173 TaxID=2529837 RepID=UPI00103DE862|nr:hypothetical protein [Acinetobacter sp. ANC 4173]TCB77439.1 hypothetical protein E0H94_14700 [Acinetobacter sp. ANC 4173]
MSNLAIIHIATIEDAPIINGIAEILGKGPDSLSVLLQDSNGRKYLGGHSWAWVEEDYQAFKSRQGFDQILTTEQLEALDRLIESVVTLTSEYNAVNDHWAPKLAELGLSEVITESN